MEVHSIFVKRLCAERRETKIKTQIVKLNFETKRSKLHRNSKKGNILGQKLFKEGNTSQAVLDRRLKEKKKLEGRYEEVQAKINDLILKAPFDGMLGTKNFSEGAFLEPGDVVVSISNHSQNYYIHCEREEMEM